METDLGCLGQVYISYWIQSGLALLGTILILLWSFGTYCLCFPILVTRYGKEAKEITRELAAKLKAKRLPSLTAALTDFQKAQCFFMMAINFAALVNKSQGGLDPTNLQQLYNNYILIRSVSVSGYLPVTLTLLGLHIVGMVSWYLLILSTLTVGVSIATLIDLGSFTPGQSDLSAIASVAEDENLKNCGGMNWTVYCLQTLDQGANAHVDPSNGADNALGFCLIVLVFVLAEQSHIFTNPATKETRTWLLKTYNLCVVDLFSLRGFEAILATLYGFGELLIRSNLPKPGLLDPVLWPLPFVPIYISYYTLAYLAYICVISHLGHGRTQKALGKLKNYWLIFTLDSITAVVWFFAGLVSLNVFAILSWSAPCSIIVNRDRLTTFQGAVYSIYIPIHEPTLHPQSQVSRLDVCLSK